MFYTSVRSSCLWIKVCNCVPSPGCHHLPSSPSPMVQYVTLVDGGSWLADGRTVHVNEWAAAAAVVDQGGLRTLVAVATQRLGERKDCCGRASRGGEIPNLPGNRPPTPSTDQPAYQPRVRDPRHPPTPSTDQPADQPKVRDPRPSREARPRPSRTARRPSAWPGLGCPDGTPGAPRPRTRPT